MIGEKKYFGKCISKELAEYIRKHTTFKEQEIVAESLGVSFNITRNLMQRRTHLKEANKHVLIELMKLAINNCQVGKEEGERLKREALNNYEL